MIQATTQSHLDIEEIKNNFVVLKNGSVTAVLKTTAVNFDLLSEIEQDAIIAAFSMFLNSLTFPVQVVIRSKRLDITKYLEKVRRIETKIEDPLLRYQAESYRKFVSDIIKRNEVLSKTFYVSVNSAGFGAGAAPAGSSPFDWLPRLLGSHSKRMTVNVDRVLQASQVQLSPRIEHLVKEFNRIGVKATQLDSQELVELFFDIYNPSSVHGQRIRTSVEDYKAAVVSPAILEE